MEHWEFSPQVCVSCLPGAPSAWIRTAALGTCRDYRTTTPFFCQAISHRCYPYCRSAISFIFCQNDTAVHWGTLPFSFSALLFAFSSIFSTDPGLWSFRRLPASAVFCISFAFQSIWNHLCCSFYYFSCHSASFSPEFSTCLFLVPSTFCRAPLEMMRWNFCTCTYFVFCRMIFLSVCAFQFRFLLHSTTWVTWNFSPGFCHFCCTLGKDFSVHWDLFPATVLPLLPPAPAPISLPGYTFHLFYHCVSWVSAVSPAVPANNVSPFCRRYLLPFDSLSLHRFVCVFVLCICHRFLAHYTCYTFTCRIFRHSPFPVVCHLCSPFQYDFVHYAGFFCVVLFAHSPFSFHHRSWMEQEFHRFLCRWDSFCVHHSSTCHHLPFHTYRPLPAPTSHCDYHTHSATPLYLPYTHRFYCVRCFCISLYLPAVSCVSLRLLPATVRFVLLFPFLPSAPAFSVAWRT